MQHCALLDQATIIGAYIDAALYFNNSSKPLQSKFSLETANKNILEIESLVNTILEEHQNDLDLLHNQINVQQAKNLDLSLSNSLALKEIQKLKEELETIRDSTNKAKIKDQVKLDKYHEWKKLDPEKLVVRNNKLSDLLSKQKTKSRIAYEALELRFSNKCNEVKDLKDRVSNLSSLTMGEAIEGKCGDLTYYPMVSVSRTPHSN